MQLRIPVHAESLGVRCGFSVFERDEGSRVTYFEGETDTDITPRRVFAIPGHPFRQPGSPLAPVARSLSGALNLLHVKNTDEGDTKKRQEHIRIMGKNSAKNDKKWQSQVQFNLYHSAPRPSEPKRSGISSTRSASSSVW